MAAIRLTASPDSTIPDLVACLRHRGLVGELAACTLYKRTGRPWPKDFRDVADPDKWEQFLLRRRLTGEGWAPPHVSRPRRALRHLRKSLIATWRALT